MSIQPHAVIEYDPFEGLDFIPPELRTTDLTHHVTVFNIDPALHPQDPADLFGLEILLGALAGARPFGEQTPVRAQTRNSFHELMAAGLRDVNLLRNLGRVGFIDVAPRHANVNADMAEKIVGAKPEGTIVAIISELFGWDVLAKELSARVNNPIYAATYMRRNPPTEKGMAWTITPATGHSSVHAGSHY